MADRWNIYPLAGISVNDFGDWSAGINLGAGFDYAVADRWDITAGLKYMIETHKNWSNPLIISVAVLPIVSEKGAFRKEEGCDLFVAALLFIRFHRLFPDRLRQDEAVARRIEPQQGEQFVGPLPHCRA